MGKSVRGAGRYITAMRPIKCLDKVLRRLVDDGGSYIVCDIWQVVSHRWERRTITDPADTEYTRDIIMGGMYMTVEEINEIGCG